MHAFGVPGSNPGQDNTFSPTVSLILLETITKISNLTSAHTTNNEHSKYI